MIKIYKYSIDSMDGITHEILKGYRKTSNLARVYDGSGGLKTIDMIDTDCFDLEEGKLGYNLYYTEPKSDEYISKVLTEKLSEKLKNEQLRHKLISSQLKGLIKCAEETNNKPELRGYSPNSTYVDEYWESLDELEEE